MNESNLKEKEILNGCKRYYYNRVGLCCRDESEVFFDALKPSFAFQKYQRWLKALKNLKTPKI